MINAKTKLCCIIGDPVEHSHSPQMHNAGYIELGLNFVFVAFSVINVRKALEGLRALNVRGIVVTIPHKLEVMEYVDEIDETAKKICAVNTIVNDNGKLKATNTDWIGGIEALLKKTKIAGKKVALLGAGGGARALAFGLKKKKAHVTVFNRTIDKAQRLVDIFDLEQACKLSEVKKIASADIIINTTPLGMEHYENTSPIPLECIQSKHVVYDIVYTPKETKLLKMARKVGAEVVYGYKMLVYQAADQFKLFTSKDAPIEIMEQIVLKNLE